MNTKKITLGLLIVLLSINSFSSSLWMRYPSISPDGKTIVFSCKGDLYKIPAEGGRAVQLTSHKAYDFMPVFSPDGSKIAYASDRYGNFDIFLISLEGGIPERLSFYSSNEYPSDFSPDGKSVLFSSVIFDVAENTLFPTRAKSELYQIDIATKDFSQLLSIPAEMAKYNSAGDKILYQDKKGVENQWRKHHTSSVTRDIWEYNITTKEHKKITHNKGENRNPLYSTQGGDIYYLSEVDGGGQNIYRITGDGKPEQISFHEKHPVRFLSQTNNGLLCYSFHGELYTFQPGKEANKIPVELKVDESENSVAYLELTSGASEMVISPDGKEIAFVLRGEVFVTAVEYNTTKRITNTSEEERNVSFSPDGRAILYASEKNGSWNIYQTKLLREEETKFCTSTLLKEEIVLESAGETFMPKFSPDGKEVAFMENRNVLKVINLESKAIRTILGGKHFYSYSDNDQWFDWSPDGKWFLVHYLSPNRWSSDLGLVDASGDSDVINLTKSGYGERAPKWMMNGEMMIWFSDRFGMRSHGSWGAQNDVLAMFFTREAYDKFKLNKEEYEELMKSQEEEKKKKDEEKEEDKKKKDKSKDDKKLVEPIKIELDQIEDRWKRLTINSSSHSDAILSPKGEKLYYLSKFDKGYDLWMHDLRKHETKLLLKLPGSGNKLQMDKKGEYLFMFSGGQILRIKTADLEKKVISYKAEMYRDKKEEVDYVFDHVWRMIKNKFYKEDLHGVDWDFYRKEYEKFLPEITHQYDFAEMMSEMLGELNVSHTGAHYRPRHKNADNTARLCVFYDLSYTGKGFKIAEIIEKGPLDNADSKIKAGIIIEKIDGKTLERQVDFFIELNHKAGKHILLSVYDPKSGDRWDEVVKPASIGFENNLLYLRWVKKRKEETERLSNGRIGYVHVRGMNDASFRKIYSEILGRNMDKDAIVVDTRFNGGGWLHDDLVTLLSGKRYMDFVPRGQYIGSEPIDKWYKKSIMLVSEGNYSDASGSPWIYQKLGTGKLVGMPVPGTMTAVWWERMMGNTFVYGIPQVGITDMDGKYLENTDIVPDIIVENEPEIVIKGRDQQLERAVQELLNGLEKDK